MSEESLIVLRVRVVQKHATCPLCQQYSNSLHSHYIRQVADLPWHGVAVRLELHTRKFRCPNELCRRKVFCERLPKVVESYARKTVRLSLALTLLAFALGGEAGARTAADLNLQASSDTLLRRIRQSDKQTRPAVRVLGVDDFAFRRGVCYGTILVDLERRQPIDLLPNRKSDTVARWLAAHPEVEIISRDRAKAYAEAANSGAPQAVQVADRWHLLKNLGEAIERLLIRQHSLWRNIASQRLPLSACSEQLPVKLLSPPIRPKAITRHQARSQLYKQAFQLREQRVPLEQIADSVGRCSRTIRRWLRAGECRLITRNRRSDLDRYWGFILDRCSAGDYSITQLWVELQKQGYRGSEITVRRYLHRKQLPAPRRRRFTQGEDTGEKQVGRTVPLISPRTAVLRLLHYEKLKEEEKPIVDQILKASPEIEKAIGLGRDFEALITGRNEAKLSEWMKKALKSSVPEIVSFVRGLEQDQAAVRAAVKYEWSQGQTEGQVNRLKLIKRQMYGRANFDLLRARVIHQS